MRHSVNKNEVNANQNKIIIFKTADSQYFDLNQPEKHTNKSIICIHSRPFA
jgi:hypothetical protein